MRKPVSFRFRTDLLECLKENALRENRTLNNYVETVLYDYVHEVPNEATKAAIDEVRSARIPTRLS